MKLPGKYWAIVEVGGLTSFLKVNEKLQVTHSLTIREDKTLEVKVNQIVVDDITYPAFTSFHVLENAIKHVDKLLICPGTKLGNHKRCRGWRSEQALRCSHCKAAIQQKIILQCHQAAQAKGPTGPRYQLDWIYECILMRIKDPCLYRHIRMKKILPLPCRTTVGRYMKKLHPMYGYQDSLFDVLRSENKLSLS